ncbi:MAG: multidrug transporter MatE [Herbaspirillum sp.]|nr:multidrug transporter MatE [Herbaspirillum sp.]
MDTPPKPPLSRQFIALAVPTLLSGFVYTLYTFIDGIFIGRYLGAESLAALNLLVPLMYVPYGLSLMIGVGGATMIARLSGEGRVDEARQVFTQALWCMLAVGMALSALILGGAGEIAALMGATGELAVHVEEYLSTYAWFILWAQALYALELFLRTEGAQAARFGLYAMFLGALVNILLDYWFIVAQPYGMKGAGLATGISMLASGGMMLSYHFFKAERIKPCRHAFKGGSRVGMMLYNGSSEFLGAIAPVVTIFAFNRVILDRYGETGLAAYAILEYMTLAVTVAMVGFVQSMQPLISFYRGARQVQAVRSVLWFGAVGALACAALAALVMFAFARQLTFLFLPDGGAAWDILARVVPWYALAFLPAACNLIIAGYLTALERPGASAIIAALRSWVVLLGSLWLLNAYFGGYAIWYALMITESLTLAVSACLLMRCQRQRKPPS